MGSSSTSVRWLGPSGVRGKETCSRLQNKSVAEKELKTKAPASFSGALPQEQAGCLWMHMKGQLLCGE